MKKKVLSLFTAIIMFCSIMCVLPNVEVNAASVTLSESDVVSGLNSQVGKSYPSGHCLAYIADFWSGMGATRSSACCASKYGDGHIDSTSMNNIPIGADVFFGNCGGGPCSNCKNSYYGHIGIYVGNGEFVHATGGKVQKSALSGWQNKYRGWGWHDYVSVNGSEPINTTVDTSYATPWNGEPIATSGLITVYNEYGTAYPQNQRNIAHNDACTVHEVYTSGFCKVTYPTASGNRTEYAKASDFNIPKKTVDTEKPNITKVSYSNVGKDRFRVEIDVTDNVKVKDVKVPTWSALPVGGNDQDDLIWHQATQYNDTHWYCDVYIKDHINVYGDYLVHVYAYDDAGNTAVYGSGITIGRFNFVYDPNGGTANGSTAAQSPKSTDPQLIYGYPNYCSMDWTKPSRTGYTFTGWYTAKTGGTQVYGADGKCKNEGTYWKNDAYKYWGDLKIYAQWKAIPYKRFLDAGGGDCSKTSVTVTYGQKIGALPVPTKAGYTFDGWYTEKTKGGIVTADTVIKVAGDATLYARWKAVTTTTKATTTTAKKTTTTTAKPTTTTKKPTTTTTKATTTAAKKTTTTTAKPTTSTKKPTTTTTKATTTTAKKITTTAKPTTTTTKPVTTTTILAAAGIVGDANCDGRVTIADATAILQSLGNPDSFKLSAQGAKNADIIGGNDGVTAADAVAIQMVDAGLLEF